MRATQFLFEYKRNITLNKLGDKLVKASSNKKTAEEILDYLEDLDPSYNKQYTVWLAQQYIKGNIQKLHKQLPHMSISWLLRDYDSVKQRLPKEKRDINQLTAQDLYNLVLEIADWDLDKPKTIYPIYPEVKGSTILYNGPFGQLSIPNTEYAACQLGRGTKWCTTSGHFESYNEDGPLIVWQDKNGEKYQFHAVDGYPDDWEIRDSSDNVLDDETLDELFNHIILVNLFGAEPEEIENNLLGIGLTLREVDRFKMAWVYNNYINPQTVKRLLNTDDQFLVDNFAGFLKENDPEKIKIKIASILFDNIDYYGEDIEDLYDYYDTLKDFLGLSKSEFALTLLGYFNTGESELTDNEIKEYIEDNDLEKYATQVADEIPWGDTDIILGQSLLLGEYEDYIKYPVNEYVINQKYPELKELEEIMPDWEMFIEDKSGNFFMFDGKKIIAYDSDKIGDDYRFGDYTGAFKDAYKIADPEYPDEDEEASDYDLPYDYSHDDEEFPERLLDPSKHENPEISDKYYTDYKDTDEYEIDDEQPDYDSYDDSDEYEEYPDDLYKQNWELSDEELQDIYAQYKKKDYIELSKYKKEKLPPENWRKTHSHLLNPDNYDNNKNLSNLDKLQDKMYKQTSKKLNNKKVSENIDRLQQLAGIKWTS